MSGRSVHIEVNPQWLDPASYVEFLNQGYPGHWNRAAYDWYIARSFHGVESETLVVTDGQRVIAGITLCYRQVGSETGSPVDVGLICATATLQSERGRGHYGRLLEATRERARMKGYAALVGFVTRDNTSGRGLVRRGARAIPSYYMVSAAGETRADRQVACASTLEAGEGVEAAYAQREASCMKGARFLYPCADDWRRQFVTRANPVRALRPSCGSLALLETVGDTDRLQWLACPRGEVTASIATLARASAAAGRQFFSYTLDPLIAAAAGRDGLEIRPGYLMLWATGCRTDAWDELANSTWTVQSGDRL